MNSTDSKQQKQVIILLVLFVVFGIVLYIQFMLKKPATTQTVSTNKPKSKGDHQIVAVSVPFVQPNGYERDPFVQPQVFDELPDPPKATPIPNRPNRNPSVKGPSGLMPLPSLPLGTQTIKQEPGASGTNVTPVAPVVHNPPSFMLVGTVLGAKKMAIVRGPSGGDQIAVGDQAADGSLLVSVTRETATFIKDGKSYKMTVGED